MSTSAAPSTPTRLLCLEDASLRHFEATVVSVDQEAGASSSTKPPSTPAAAASRPIPAGCSAGMACLDGHRMSKAGGAVVHTVDPNTPGGSLPPPGERRRPASSTGSGATG